MEMSEGLIKAITDYKNTKSISLGGLGHELRHYYQQTYNFSVDVSCSGCISRAFQRIIKDNNI
jgi:hypothetical protein